MFQKRLAILGMAVLGLSCGCANMDNNNGGLLGRLCGRIRNRTQPAPVVSTEITGFSGCPTEGCPTEGYPVEGGPILIDRGPISQSEIPNAVYPPNTTTFPPLAPQPGVPNLAPTPRIVPQPQAPQTPYVPSARWQGDKGDKVTR